MQEKQSNSCKRFSEKVLDQGWKSCARKTVTRKEKEGSGIVLIRLSGQLLLTVIVIEKEEP